MPFSRGDLSAICSFHWPGSVRKPSASTLDGRAGEVAVLMRAPLVGAWAPSCGADAGDVAAGQQRVPVDRLEQQLGEVVGARLAQQRQRAEALRRVAAGQRLDVVVEVDQERLLESGLDEAVGVPVERALERLAGEEAADVLGERVGLEVRDRARLRGREVRRVADREHVGRGLRLQRVRVGRDEAGSSPRPGERSTNAAPACSGIVTSRSNGCSRSS